ncbi:hypothetical protein Peur_022767 [Populus x canadensis]
MEKKAVNLEKKKGAMLGGETVGEGEFESGGRLLRVVVVERRWLILLVRLKPLLLFTDQGTKSCGTITVEVLAASNVGLGCCCRLEIMADVESGSVSQGLRMTRSWQPWITLTGWHPR